MVLHSVAAGDLEALLVELQNTIASNEEGIFGPGSVTWKINRESALFLAAGRAALLQLAHPWVAAAIAQHSRTLDDPIGRFHNTFRVIYSMVFGPADQAFAAARKLHRRHQAITGILPESVGRFGQRSAYEANDPSALAWVYATLIDSALQAYELVLPPLTDPERTRYFEESLRMAALFGIAREVLPESFAQFNDYMEAMLHSDVLAVSPASRHLAQRLQSGAGLLIPVPFWYRALTYRLLPGRIREEFGFAYGEREQISAEKALKWLLRSYPRLPDAVRFVGPYREAEIRLRARKPNLAVQLSNRLWIGQPSLFVHSETKVAHRRKLEAATSSASHPEIRES